MSGFTKLQNDIIKYIESIRVERKQKMNKQIYDILKWASLVGLPALAAFWLTIAPIWGLPYGDQIGSTIIAINVLLGTLVGVSSAVHTSKSNKKVK